MAVRVAVVQASSAGFDLAASLARAEQWITEAAQKGAQLVVLPEAFLGSYPRGADFGAVVGSRSAAGRELFRRYSQGAVTVPGPETERLGALAARYGCELVVGIVERVGATLYCSAVFLAGNGELRGVHRKLQPTGSERLIWGQGDGSTLHVFGSPIGQIGAAICWENMMPALRLSLYAQGVQFWCAPTADARDSHIATMRHIAAEGRCFVLAANQFTTRGDYPDEYDSTLSAEPGVVVCRGGSVIVGPLGDILAGPLYDKSGVLVAEVDLEDITRARFDFDPVGHYSRPDIFSLNVDRSQRVPVVFSPDRTMPGTLTVGSVNKMAHQGRIP
ncbi:nitrilase-related carbon-nitrogen hydrolase [Streptomyces sp. NPDC056669]|uniref:nitrilase-related carbon-nitrogen hydrolase n=1 Tax=unclassified Streptomyces TaxID=2593676 RepID=UPI0036973B55